MVLEFKTWAGLCKHIRVNKVQANEIESVTQNITYNVKDKINKGAI